MTPMGTPSRSNGVTRMVRVPEANGCLVFDSGNSVLHLCCEVMDVNRLPIDYGSAVQRAAGNGLLKTEMRLNRPIVGCQSQYISLDEPNHRIV